MLLSFFICNFAKKFFMKKLYVKNFGPVKEANVELRDINLFIGEQSIGKSTLAKLITILTDYISLCKLIISSETGWMEQLKVYNLDVYKDNKYKIKYDIEESNITFHVDISPNKLSSYMLRGGKRVTKKDSIILELLNLKPIFHKELFFNIISKKKSISESGNNSDELIEFMNNSLYVPAERILYSVISKLMPALQLTKSTIPNNFLRFMVELTNAKSTYPLLDVPLLNISYKNDGSEDYFILKNNKNEYPLTTASSGIQSTIPLLLVLQYAINKREYSSFVIEEPECNLFPEKQVELLKFIISVVKNDKRTLTITTHSPYLLSAMNNYLYAGTLVHTFGDNIRESVSEILSESYQLKPGECSVYSLGERINGYGIYCKSLIDEKTGMIDYNTLDSVTAIMSEEFDKLEDAFIQMNR